MLKIWPLIGAVLLVAAVTMSLVLAIATPPAQAQGQSTDAIYLSPGPQQGVPWGGYHVTVTGFSSGHAPGKSVKHEAAEAWKKVHGAGTFNFENKHKGKDYWACNLGKPQSISESEIKSEPHGYGICFKSDQLDALTMDLSKRKFQNQKQVAMVKGGKGHWHVSLYAKSEADAYKKFEGIKHQSWKLYVVKNQGKDWTPV